MSTAMNYNVTNAGDGGGEWDGDIYFIGNGLGYTSCQTIFCLSNANPAAQLNDTGNGSDADPGTIDGSGISCPSYYYNHDSPFSNSGTTYESLAGTNKPWGANAYNFIGQSSCGDDGQAAIWYNLFMGGGGHARSVDYTIDPNMTTSGSMGIEAAIFCGNIDTHSGCPTHKEGLDSPSGRPNNTWSADHGGGNIYYFASGYTVNIAPWPITHFTGNVQSDPIAATGQRFANQGNIVSYARVTRGGCDWANAGHVSTDANGSFDIGSFREFQPICIQSNTQGATAAGPYSWSYGGTYYSNIRPPNYPWPPGTGNDPPNGSNPNTWSSWDSQQVCKTTSCGGYNFYWLPAGVAPITVKSIDAGIFSGGGANAGPGAALHPGDRDDFYMTMSNPYDVNNPNDAITDQIPLNIDPASVVIDSENLYQSGGPPGWRVNTASLLPSGGVPLWLLPYQTAGYCYFLSGYVGHCGNSQNQATFGGGATPPFISLGLNAMPAYSTLQVHWHGTVRAATNQIGVYPGYSNNGDTRYCANPSGVDYANFNTIFTNCQDLNGGFEGVSNFTTTSAGCGMDSTCPTVGNVSDITYRPIPPPTSSLSACIEKNYLGYNDANGTDQRQVGRPPVYTTRCGPGGIGFIQPPPVNYIYLDPGSPGLTGDDNGLISMQPFFSAPTPGYGRTIYDIDDQWAGGGLDSAMEETACSPGYNAANQYVSCTVTGVPNSSQHITWSNFANDGGGWSPVFSFNNDWNNPGAHPIGGCAPNTAQVTAHDDSTNPHQLYAYPSNTICIKHIVISEPGIQVTQNDVDAGASTAQGCQPNPGGPNDRINTNPSTGQYVVSASGALGSFSSNTTTGGNTRGGLTQHHYDLVCLPDVSSTVSAWAASHPSASINSGNIDDSTNVGGTNGYDGYVMKGNVSAGGTFNFGTNATGTTTINRRWTLYVNGNVYINSNINFGPQGSLAIVATGNIMIDHNVTAVSGFLYAGSGTTVSDPTKGTINTCEFPGPGGVGLTLGDPTGYDHLDCDKSTGHPLTITGSLFARHYRFNRTTTDNTPAEIINFNPQLFLYTPPGLSDIGTYTQPTYSLTSPRY